MSLNGTWIPQDETEDRLMEDIHIATRRAHADGVPKERVAALLAFMASATLDPSSDEEPDTGIQEPTMDQVFDQGREPPGDTEACPECDTEIDEVIASMGGDLQVLPCGCQFEWEEREALGQFTDDFEPEGTDDR